MVAKKKTAKKTTYKKAPAKRGRPAKATPKKAASKKVASKKASAPNPMQCGSHQTDHPCLGPDKAHVGMWVTSRVGSDKRPYRMVWVSSTGRQAVIMRHEHLSGRTQVAYSKRGPGLMIREGSDGRWFEEGHAYVGKQALTMGLGIEDLDRGF